MTAPTGKIRQEPWRPGWIRDAWQDSIWKRVGIEWRDEPLGEDWGSRGGWVRVRWPFLAAVAAVLPVVRVIREQRRRRALRRLAHGMCPRCGRDIRKTPLECPHCGMETSRIFR